MMTTKRVSTDKVDRQERICRDIAERLGVTVAHDMI